MESLFILVCASKTVCNKPWFGTSGNLPCVRETTRLAGGGKRWNDRKGRVTVTVTITVSQVKRVFECRGSC